MFYFLNDNIQRKKSGIEHAQIKRLNLFNQFNVPAKIVTRQFATDLHEVTREAGIDDTQLINLYDYFQDAQAIDEPAVMIQDLQLDSSWKRVADGINYNFYRDKQRMLYIRRHSETDKRIENVQYFDHFGKLLKVDWYDFRGFISVEQVYDWDSHITTENYLRPDGSIALQKTHLLNRRDKETVAYHLFNFHGADYQFDDFDELTRFFYDQLVIDQQKQTDQSVNLIIDRVYELGWSVLHMEHHVFRACQLHNDHVNDPEDMLHSTLNYNYAWGLNHFADWDGVICLTTQQQKDVQDRFTDDTTKIYQIPGPIVPAETLNAAPIDFSKRTPYSVVMVARLSPEKQQDHLIQAWQQVAAKFPQATLDFWGYENGDTGKTLKEQVKQAQLTNSITFRGYTNDVAEVYDNAQLLILPSRAEGLPLSLVEAQSHGLPIIANDIKYGPADVVIDGQDGVLTQDGDIDGLAQAIISLLADQQKLAQFSEHAYQDSARFSEENVMKKWQTLINDTTQKEVQ
ncbi:glycosyltransferase [Paucilactobacillus wasatchensis]|uniref:Poly(Glycerol-phosphate) alpha-glucosyltransferase n=1 Tax=Paucilactobacillus wasatchensis TaxID=1335616 RepID=A0A0D1AA18_9LACO|nr:glycosyltransferase [Paucilactobacillus wasatchensis]KIS03566.1 Poly(glycerol-phosphate) alpha-glucosyltransferase [Paucilactobacillus wasatchensis]